MNERLVERLREYARVVPWLGEAADAIEEAHAPTDDEREALIEQATWALIDNDTDVVDRGVSDEHYRERRADVERVFPILARRTVQGEPEAPNSDLVRSGALGDLEEFLGRTPEGTKLLPALWALTGVPAQSVPHRAAAEQGGKKHD